MALGFGNVFRNDPEYEEEDPHKIKEKHFDYPSPFKGEPDFQDEDTHKIKPRKTDHYENQQLFANPKELINYDYYDVANGTGYQIFYGASCNNTAYITSSTKINSESRKTMASSANLSTTYAAIQNVNFDITFNTAKNIKGDIMVNVPIGIQNRDGGDAGFYMYGVVRVYHYDGATETQLGSTATSKEVLGDIVNLARLSNNFCFKITQATIKHFKAGETLRVNIITYFKASAINYACAYGFAHDPSGRYDKGEAVGSYSDAKIIDDTDTTTLSIHVPFVINI